MKPRIVVADDSLVMRAVVRRCLDDHGYDVIEAEDGAAALEACQASNPTVALLDIEMPIMNGYQVLAAMKADADLADIPVVFLTGRTDTTDIVEGLRLGAHDYLKKPFEPAELIARVSAAARLRALQDELRQRNAELDALGRIDALTGLSNRRHGQESLDRRVSIARRHGITLSVLMIDVDHFKQVNDTEGHLVGDVVLRIVAARLRTALDAQHQLVRWGGEEFVALAAGLDDAAVADLAERLRTVICEAPFAVDESRSLSITVSLGCVSGRVDALSDVLQAADEALYEAKRNGRNRVAARRIPAST